MNQFEQKDISALGMLTRYGLCCALVVVYVNTFFLWSWLNKELGRGAALLPFAVLLAVLAGIGLAVWRKQGSWSRGLRWPWLAGGIACLLLALWLPDSRFPAKRVHVAEYLLLAVVVRSILSLRLQGGRLFLYTVLVTALFGIHDEMLQGLHPLRSYGLRDITVNSLAGLGGACLGPGLQLFVRKRNACSLTGTMSYSVLDLCLFVLLLVLAAISLWALLLVLPNYRNHAIPWWLLAPLFGLLVGGLLLVPELRSRRILCHGMAVVFWQLLALLCYPVIAHVAMVQFS